MNDRKGAGVVLVVDEDIGLIWWLGEIFIEAGFQPVPALNAREALTLCKALKLSVAIVVINPELAGTAGLLQTLGRASNPKIVLIQDPTFAPPSDIEAHVRLDRPAGWEPVSRPDWLRKVRNILMQLGIRAAS